MAEEPASCNRALQNCGQPDNLLLVNTGEVAERLNAAVCQFTLTCSDGPIFVSFLALQPSGLGSTPSFAVFYCSANVHQEFLPRTIRLSGMHLTPSTALVLIRWESPAHADVVLRCAIPGQDPNRLTLIVNRIP
jgi:hypothetical protein